MRHIYSNETSKYKVKITFFEISRKSNINLLMLAYNADKEIID